ncbi:hypothetical protein COMA2_130079 [Candidatus Nitrospira nitrificans]|uniref:Uncharacterized protein n=1 Tax=Candidatus Nitrospira nitrificans TaxID=1742973 RepID=A0A0S4LA56_9BACT|nr:hypothetical protein COMA2_130079 [Candidatus Nitrospira nitrificans]
MTVDSGNNSKSISANIPKQSLATASANPASKSFILVFIKTSCYDFKSFHPEDRVNL